MTRKEVIGFFKTKYESGQVEGYHIVVALIAMVKDKKIKLDDVHTMLIEILGGDMEKSLKALSVAHDVIDDNIVDQVVKGLHSTLG